MGDANPICTLGDYSSPSHEGYRNIIELLEGKNVVHLQSDTIRNAEESWALFEDHALYDNEIWNDPRDFAKPVKPISLPQDVPSASDRHLIELENQVQRLMEAHLAPKQPIQVNKITSSCEICSVPHDTQYCIENLEQAFVDYASPPTDEAGGVCLSLETQLGQHQDDMISKINLLWKTISKKLDDMPTRNTAGNPTAQMNFTSTNYPTKEELRGKGIKSPSKLLSPKYIVTENKDHEITSEIEEEFEEETKEETEKEEEDNLERFDTFLIMKELGYHEWLLKNPQPPWVKAKIRIEKLNNVKFSYMIGHFEKKQACLDMESLINVMSKLHNNWIMSNRLEPRRKPSNPKKICNFVGRVRGLNFFIGNFTYECDFMALEDTTSVIDHDLGLVVFEKPFVEETGLVYDMKKGTVVFEKDKEKIVFKMPHKMEMLNT
ncbi:hypothetical protein Tco_0518920 [Tanacetum coccineum]